MTAPLVWRWLIEVLAGLSLKAATERLRLPFALETVYGLGRKLRRQLDRLRTRLCRQCPPPLGIQADPLLQTVEHLRRAFPCSACPAADFQRHFQHPFLG